MSVSFWADTTDCSDENKRICIPKCDTLSSRSESIPQVSTFECGSFICNVPTLL